MDGFLTLPASAALAPPALMALAALLPGLPVLRQMRVAHGWRTFALLSAAALLAAAAAAWAGAAALLLPAGLKASPLGLLLAVLVQLLGAVIGGFSTRYLHGEAGQRRFMAALAAVLAGVHLLLLADHWAVLIVAWAWVGMALRPLLCFYPDRPFALLAAHKKRLADRAADALLLAAAGLAWAEVGSGSLSALWEHVATQGLSDALQGSAVCLVLAVILRSALLPVHGWLIQVMEAPTPVSALLHAGVVNLGGFVLIRFAPLLQDALPARMLLLMFGLGIAVLAGMVMLTCISIKVRLAWSTVAQMGFMLLECAVGLYTLAALHLVGHSLYKAQAFLSSSMVVRQTRLHALAGHGAPVPASLWMAPLVTVPAVLLVQSAFGGPAWPAWWSAVLGLAWAPLLWLPAGQGVRSTCMQGLSGVGMVIGLTGATLLAHRLPLDVPDGPHAALGWVALGGLAALYLGLVALLLRPDALRGWRRWSYAGFYVDEAYTRVALTLWPARWTPAARRDRAPSMSSFPLVDASR